MKDKILKIVVETIHELNEEINSTELQNPTLETRLYGAKSAFDSISLVMLIADIEDKIRQEFGVDIVLADERAMSQLHSPFGRVGYLVQYIEEKIAGDAD